MNLRCRDAGSRRPLRLLLDPVLDDGSIRGADKELGSAAFDALDRRVRGFVADELLALDRQHQFKCFHAHRGRGNLKRERVV